MTRRPSALAALAALTLLAALMLTVTPSTSLACSCIAMTHDMAVARFDASFRGRVTSVTREGDDALVTFHVVEIFRGVDAGTRTIVVRRYAELAPCPIPVLALGQVYRVYASRGEDGLRVHYCNPSGP